YCRMLINLFLDQISPWKVEVALRMEGQEMLTLAEMMRANRDKLMMLGWPSDDSEEEDEEDGGEGGSYDDVGGSREVSTPSPAPTEAFLDDCEMEEDEEISPEASRAPVDHSSQLPRNPFLDNMP
ncbi:hypothetical protein PMAYCL1PPCAC_19306, partial [Pristionchus mayeri]